MGRGSWESWDGVSNRASREGNYRIAGISPVISRSFWDKTRLAALSSRVERIRPIILSAVLAAQEGPGAGSAGAKREIRNIISAWHGEPPLFRRPSTLHRTRAMANSCPKRAARVSEREKQRRAPGTPFAFSLGLVEAKLALPPATLFP